MERCAWCGSDPLYISYHDTEWGVPEYDDRILWEKLILDGFQAGLSWLTILQKRENFRLAFDNFDPEKIAHYDSARCRALMENKGIIRNRLKIEATISNARSWIKIMEMEGFANYLWNFCDGQMHVNYFRTSADVPSFTDLSVLISRDLKSRGFRFCGPTITYAFMQAVGMVNDHIVDCPRHNICTSLGALGSLGFRGLRL